MARRGTIRNMGRVQKELADARRARAKAKREKAEATQQGAPTPDPSAHLDYAAEAESAERGYAWPQAAALWRRAAACIPKHPNARMAKFRDQYLANADGCDRRQAVDGKLEAIAKNTLHIATLKTRGNDSLDFHDLGVAAIKLALHRAYLAGYEAGWNADR